MNVNYQILFDETLIEHMAMQYPMFFSLDDETLIPQILNSLSLDLMEKHRVIEHLPTLSIQQMTDLKKVFVEEKEKFEELFLEYPKDMVILVGKMIIYDLILMIYVGVINNKAEERQIISDLFNHYQQTNPELLAMAKAQADKNRYWYYLFQQANHHQISETGDTFSQFLNQTF